MTDTDTPATIPDDIAAAYADMGFHHPTAPADPEMLPPHPRTTCERDRCGLPPWRAEDQELYRQGYAAGYAKAIDDLSRVLVPDSAS